MIHYAVKLSDPSAHIFTVSCVVSQPDPAGQRFRMPAWIPGSYMIRDFSKHVLSVSASSGEKNLSVSKTNKDEWIVESCDDPITLIYDVYAWDLSVRAAHFDQTHAYFNGTSVFMAVMGQEHTPCELDLQKPGSDFANNWRVATSLKESGAQRYGFGLYLAENYDDLIDHPVEITDFDLITFEACGVPHDLVLSGRHYADLERIAVDLKKICEHHIRFFGSPAPMERYVFLTWVVGDGYGGLEHRASTSLICSRSDLPSVNDSAAMTDGYCKFLGLCSHEYFHTWNIKRIKPSVFLPYDLRAESHTELLWAFEGITSYYDDLSLVQTGLITPKRYLALLGQTLSRVKKTKGRLRQTVTESSFDAWTKFYKQDENAINAIISYYAKGALIALGLDLLMRKLTGHQCSLADVMVMLWQDYGQKHKGLEEREIERVVLQVADAYLTEAGRAELMRYFDVTLRTTKDYDFESLLKQFGVAVDWHVSDTPSISSDLKSGVVESPVMSLGVVYAEAKNGVKLRQVVQGGAAHQAGLSAGDIVVAIDHLKVSKSSVEKMLQVFESTESVVCHAFRQDELMVFNVMLQVAEPTNSHLTLEDKALAKGWILSA